MTAIVIFLVFASIVAVLWIGARDVRAGTMTPGELVQFVIYSVMVAGSVAALSEIWGELQRAAGATERMVELIHAADPIRDPARAARRLPARMQGRRSPSRTVTFRYPARPETPALHELDLRIRPGETVALVGPSGRRQDHDLPAPDAVLRPGRGPGDARRHRPARDGADRPAPAVRAGAAGAGDLRRLGAGEHPLRPAGGERRRGRGGGPRRGGARVHRAAAAGATTPTWASAG